MDTPTNRIVYKERYGRWVNKLEYADEPCSVHYTQLAAVASAKVMLREQGGGTLLIRGFNGKIKDRIEIDPKTAVSVTRIEGGFK
jgi:hypothetical protein